MGAHLIKIEAEEFELIESTGTDEEILEEWQREDAQDKEATETERK